jgi:hypothetical protein
MGHVVELDLLGGGLGKVSAARIPPTGSAVCLIPSARPRCRCSNQAMTARPLAALTDAPRAPATVMPTAKDP